MTGFASVLRRGMRAGLLYKGLWILRVAFWTGVVRLSVYGAWSVGKRFRAEGFVAIRSLRGRVTIGEGVTFGALVNIAATEGAVIAIGDGVSVNQGTYVIARCSVSIGRNTRVGEYCSIRDNSHVFDATDVPVADQGYVSSEVAIGEDVWLGRCVTVMPGVVIGDGAIVGAHAVVTKNVAPFAIVAGVPARVIGHRGGKLPAGQSPGSR